MTIRFRLFVFCFFISAIPAYSQWSWVNPETSGALLQTTYFINNHIGFAAGEDGMLLKTEDEGKNWKVMQSGTHGNIRSIIFTSPEEGYFATEGKEGAIFHTSDGGENWTKQVANNSASYIAMCFTDNQTGYAASTYNFPSTEWEASIIKTTDGGQSWGKLDTGGDFAFSSLYFVNSSLGFASASFGTILKTTNAGASWTELNTGTTDDIKEVVFSGADTGYAIVNGNNENNILRSTDGGNSWIVINSMLKDVNSIFFTSSKTGYASGENGLIASTTDGGLNWTKINMGGNSFSSMFFTDQNNGCIVGSEGKILNTINAGKKYEVVSGNSITGNSLRKFFFLDDKTIFISGSGSIIRSLNGGISWDTLCSSGASQIWAVYFSDINNGKAVTSSGTTFETLDGGSSWKVVNFGTVFNPLDIYFIDADRWIISAKFGKIYRTTNAGINWEIVNCNLKEDLRSISFVSPEIGYIAGGEGSIIKTTDYGASWNIIKKVGGELNTISFVDHYNGFAAGSHWDSLGEVRGFIASTNDGGISWKEQILGGYSALNSLFFLDARTGYAVGDSGTILKSTDGALSWQQQPSGTSAILNNIVFKNPTEGFIIGQEGIILYTKSGGEINVAVKQQLNTMPSGSFLGRNYPNPFNPSTKIYYQLADAGIVTLKIYDALGRELKTLIQEYQEPGSYNYFFEAGNLPSGVYFYKLNCNKFSASGKMMLLR